MPLIIEGRPDHGNYGFGKTYLKQFPAYGFGTTKLASLVHKILYVQCSWYEPCDGGVTCGVSTNQECQRERSAE